MKSIKRKSNDISLFRNPNQQLLSNAITVKSFNISKSTNILLPKISRKFSKNLVSIPNSTPRITSTYNRPSFISPENTHIPATPSKNDPHSNNLIVTASRVLFCSTKILKESSQPSVKSPRVSFKNKSQIPLLPKLDAKNCLAEIENNDISYILSSEASSGDIIPPLDPVDTKKFNSPFIRKQTTKRSTIGSLLSQMTFTKQQSISVLSNENTIGNILEDMNTQNIISYNELKIKFVTQDSLFEGVNGSLIKWKAIEIIGNGSFGQAIKALDIESGRFIAVKRLYYNLANASHLDLVSLYQQEISILKKLKNKHIVKYLGSEKINDNYCMYTEFVPDGSLAKLIYKIGPLPEITVKKYTRQIVKGLVYLHKNEVIHRDLKCENVLVDSRGVLKLCDFGCSKAYENSDESCFVKSVKGSLPWMAPEVMKNTGHGRKADIWSLGCVVLEMVTGKHPWDGIENHVLLMMKVVVQNEIPEVPSWLSEKGKDFIIKCLERDPSKRMSARELLSHPFLERMKKSSNEC